MDHRRDEFVTPPVARNAERVVGVESEPVEGLVPRDGLPPVDPDLALLEAYLDGEMASSELAALQARLGADGELSAALGRLSADYDVRRAVWTSLEGNNADADRAARAVGRSIRRAGYWERSWRSLRVGAAVAACAVCFVAGWVGRGSSAVAVDHTASRTLEPVAYQVILTDEQGNATAVQKFDDLAEAQAFAADVGKWQAEQAQQAQLQNGQSMLTKVGL